MDRISSFEGGKPRPLLLIHPENRTYSTLELKISRAANVPGGRERLPKRAVAKSLSGAELYPYYAGYAFDWARERLIEQSHAGYVLDPWNGSGTTLRAAASLGLPAVGLDLNPAASQIAKLRLSDPKSLKVVRRKGSSSLRRVQDPLHAWLTPQLAGHFRDWINYDSPLVRVACFQVLREITKSFEGSNPTWVRKAKPLEHVTLRPRILDELVEEAQAKLLSTLVLANPLRAQSVVVTASASRMPIRTDSVPVILTSPPYLTRIDYAVAFSRELALMRANPLVRSQLMGTTQIRQAVDPAPILGNLAARTLSSISSHNSKDSNGYYRKQVLQYLSDMMAAVAEISRVCQSGAHVVLVVQDSFYKDVHISLADIWREACELQSFELLDQQSMIVNRSLVTLNTQARGYSKETVAESVLTLKRRSRGF